MTSRRNRRRVFRQSDAAGYDRSADKPGAPASHGVDEERIVTVDDADSAAAEGSPANAMNSSTEKTSHHTTAASA